MLIFASCPKAGFGPVRIFLIHRGPVLTLGSGPPAGREMRNETTSRAPLLAASSNGVLPHCPNPLTSAPSSTSRSIIGSVHPALIAVTNGGTKNFSLTFSTQEITL
jgi:hypothetical protein